MRGVREERGQREEREALTTRIRRDRQRRKV